MREFFQHFKPRTLELALAVAGWGLYVALFALLFDVLGSQVAALVLLPVSLIAWLWGFRAGLLAGVACLAVNTLLFNLINPELGGWDAVFRQRGGAGHVATLFLGGVVGYLRDVRRQLHTQKEQLIAQHKQLLHLSQHDALTGLPNRSLFRDRLEQAVVKAQRSGELAAVYFLDLNGFKKVNDTLGHAAGDELLRQIATRLAGRCRESDTLARMGGDEFTVVATGLKDEAGVKRVAEILLEAFHLPFVIEGREVSVGSSLGVALYPQDGQNADELLQVADSAMYAVKRSQSKIERDMTKYLTSH